MIQQGTSGISAQKNGYRSHFFPVIPPHDIQLLEGIAYTLNGINRCSVHGTEY